jgi:hypothetical protein
MHLHTKAWRRSPGDLRRRVAYAPSKNLDVQTPIRKKARNSLKKLLLPIAASGDCGLGLIRDDFDVSARSAQDALMKKRINRER